MKKMGLSPLAFFVLLCLNASLFGQNQPTFHCASDEMMQARSELMERQQLLEKAILQKNENGALGKSANPPYTLPLVVHIVHDNAAGDIPDAQVFAAIEQLNQAFSHQGYYADLGDGFDTQIQFCLAKRTPDGSATNGITRSNSPLSNINKDFEDQELKDLIRWDTKDYINVWVVNAINSSSSGSGVVGYAYLASAHGQPYDGIVCEAGYFGTSPKNTAVLIHEMGHYLNLYHTFQGGCPNGNCLTNGDRVCDTPPDQVTFSACGFNSCGTDTDDTSPNNPLTTDVADRTENYMDYSPFDCYHAFTEGQANRMNDAIEFARSSLLESEGCLDPCTIPIVADFSASATDIFAGETVSFSNLTTGGTVFEWSIGGSAFSTDFDADFTFNDVGVFEVLLQVGNDDANCQEEVSVFINVKCPVVAGFEVNATELEIGETFVATNTSQNATEYEWWINGVLVSTGGDLSYVFSNDGFYTILLIAKSNSCSNQSSKLVEVALDTPCSDSITGSYFQLINATISTYLSFSDILPNEHLFLNVYHPWISGSILKTEQNGNIIWSKTIQIPVNGFDYGLGRNVQATPDEGCIASFQGSNVSERIVFKTDKDGNTEWSKLVSSFTVTDTRGLGNDVILFGGDIVPQQFRAVRLDKDGNEVWNKVYNLDTGIHFFQNTLSADGTAYWIVGHAGTSGNGAVVLKLSLDGELLFIRKYGNPNIGHFEFTSVDATPDNGFIAVGRRTITGTPTDNDFLICKADAMGHIEWTKRIDENIPTQAGVSGNNVLSKPDGSGYIARYFQLGGQSYWLSFSLNGDLEYAKTYDWDNGEQVYFSVVKMNGQLFATGRNPDVYGEMFFVEYDPETGPNMGCIVQTDELLEAVDFDWQISDYAFSLSSETISVENTTITELPNDYFILQQPFCSEEIPCPEDCTNSLDDDEDGYVDCFDTDCDCFDGVDCMIQPSNPSISAKIEWRTNEESTVNSTTPIIANLDPQNGQLPEIIVPAKIENFPTQTIGYELLFFLGDGSNKENPESLSIPEGNNTGFAPMAVADVNRDGTPELLFVTADQHIQVYTDYQPNINPVMKKLATSDVSTERERDQIGLADFDMDGIAEVYVGNKIFKFDFSDPFDVKLENILSGSSSSGAFANWVSQSMAMDMLTPADCNGDPDCNGLELVTGLQIYSIDLNPFDGDGLQIKVQRDINNMAPGHFFSDGFANIADIDLDGVLDIVVNKSFDQSIGVFVWNKNGLLFKYETSSSSIKYSGVAIANVFDDREAGYLVDLPEIISVADDIMHCANFNKFQTSSNDPFWWSVPYSDTSTDSSPSVFDLDGDGYAEVLARDHSSFRIIYGGPAPFPSGVDNNRSWYSFNCFSQTNIEYPAVADVDLDGEAEIVFTAGALNMLDLTGWLYVVGSSDESQWMPARSLLNQYQYNPLSINDDLTVPKDQQAPHLELPELGSGNRPFNAVHSQAPVLNSDFSPYMPVADAQLKIDSAYCDLDSIGLMLTICNHGSFMLDEGLPISFYQNDPTATTATMLGTTLTNFNLPIDSCLSFSLKIPAIYNTPIFVLVNDNSTLPTPFDIAVDFPNTDVLECDYENNLAQFEVSYQSHTLDLGPDITTCNSSTNTLNAGSGFVKYRWQDGSEDSTFTAWEVGKYWVDVWDICGFKHTDTIFISPDLAAEFDLGNDFVICEGETVSLSVSGYSDVHWWPAEGLSCTNCPTTDAAPMASVTYHATASVGICFSSDSIRITLAPYPEFSLDTVAGNCSEPAIISAIQIGEGALDYLWSNGSSGASVQVSQSGNYTVTATNPAGCSTVDSIDAIVESVIGFSSEIMPILCYDETGSISLDILQTVPPYNITWSNGETSDSLFGLLPGNYSVTITDANGCVGTDLFILENPSELTIAPTFSHISCNNEPGNIALHVEGGTGNLSYTWSNGGVGDSIAITSPGDYAATVTDANGCSLDFSENIVAEEPLAVTIIFNEIQCPGGMDGSAALAPLNGTPPYNFSWENGQLDSLIIGLGSEPHSVTISDAEGCEKALNFSLIEPDPIVANLSATPVKCFGETNGSANVSPSGGSPGYAYLWSNGATTQAITNLPSGEYQVTITDDHGCQDSASVLVAEPEELEVIATADPNIVCPNETGSLFATATGGTSPFDYTWNNLASDSFLVNVTPGMYSVSVVDAYGCEAENTIILEEWPPFSIQDYIEMATGGDIADGAISLEIINGTPPFSFLWNNGASTPSVQDLLPGTYSVTITDAIGCTEVFDFEVGFMVGATNVMQQSLEVSLFPNPGIQSGDAVLSIKTNFPQTIEYKLFNVAGQLLWGKIMPPSKQHIYIPLQSPDIAGVYFMEIIGEEGHRAYMKWVVVGPH